MILVSKKVKADENWPFCILGWFICDTPNNSTKHMEFKTNQIQVSLFFSLAFLLPWPNKGCIIFTVGHYCFLSNSCWKLQIDKILGVIDTTKFPLKIIKKKKKNCFNLKIEAIISQYFYNL